MRRLFRTEDILEAFVSAIGWGLGYAIPKSWNMPRLFCILSSIILGLFMGGVADKLIKNKWEKKDAVAKDLTFIAIIVVFSIVASVCERVFHYSLWEDFRSEIFLGSVGFSVAGFFIVSIIQWIKTYYIRLRYRDGSLGHTMSDKELKYIEKLKGENREIKGDYDKSLAVKTENGIFVAKADFKVLEYLGIPYAKPPVGELRWKAPRKPDPSDRVWEACYFGASPIQGDGETISLKTHTQSEDCLTLNVWRSAKIHKNDSLKPVLVYIHGGSLVFGGSAEPLYNGRSFVESFPEAIVVTFNYRLGIFGFVDITDMPGGGEYKDARNLGIMDQSMALNWIHDNIRSFGGDPDNIMLAGDTMGALCVCILATLKETNGLFKKALVISYSDVNMTDTQSIPRLRFSDFKRAFGVETAEDMLNIPAEKLKKFMMDTRDKYWYIPYIDGKLLKKSVEESIREGDSGNIRFIYGIPSDEFSTWLTVSNEEIMHKWIEMTLADIIKETADTEDGHRLTEMIAHDLEAGIPEREAKKNALRFWFYIYGPLKKCISLSQLGKTVRCFYWDVEAPVEKFGRNSISAVGTLLGNSQSAENLGIIIDNTIEHIFQHLICNELVSDRPELGYDEVKGVDRLTWNNFDADRPAVLHFTKNNVEMDERVLAEDIKRVRAWTG